MLSFKKTLVPTALAAMIAPLAAEPLPASAASSCKLEQVGSLPMILTTSRRIVIPATVNGVEVKLLLDTGASSSALFSNVAEKIGLTIHNRNGYHLYGLGGEVDVYQAPIKEIKVGNAVSRDEDINIFENEGKNYFLDGVLGASFLTNFDVEIDLATNIVKLFKQTHCSRMLPYWEPSGFMADFSLSGSHHAEIIAKINGTRLSGTLDTGAPHSFLSWSAANRIGIEKDSPGVEKINGKGGGLGKKTFDAYYFRIDSLEFGGETINGLPANIMDAQIKTGTPTGSHISQQDDYSEFLLGMDFFMYNHVFIDYGDQSIYFTEYNGDQIKAVRASMKDIQVEADQAPPR